MAVSLTNDIAKLEMAAQVMMAPPNHVTPEHRKEAENFLLDFRERVVSIDICRQILEATQNHFLMFEAAQVLAQSILKQWSTFSDDDVMGVCQYLIQFCISRLDLPNFVKSEVLHSLSIILKWGSIHWDGSKLFNFILESIESFMHSDNESMQSFGLQMIETIVTEFSLAWRSCGVAITWDFHTRAKKFFETLLLKKFLQLSLTTLNHLLLQSDLSSPVHISICDKFLRILVIVFSWNFTPKLITSTRLRVLATVLKTNSFRPPVSWNDLFQDGSIVTFFAQLHNRIRHREELCINSLNCLVQLASIMGGVLGSIGDDGGGVSAIGGGGSIQLTPISSRVLSSAAADNCTYDFYVQNFVTHIIDLFSQLHDYEVAQVSLIIYRIFTYHPIVLFKRFPKSLISRFITFLSDMILKLTQPAMEFAMQKNEHVYHEALHNLYQVWRNILRSALLFGGGSSSAVTGGSDSSTDDVQVLIIHCNVQIVDQFLKSVTSAPFGCRSAVAENEIVDENEEEEDDREAFADILCDMGYFSLHSLDYFTEFVGRILLERMQQFRAVNASTTMEEIRAWQEDMHWTLLVMGFQLQQNSFDCISNLPQELAQRCLSGYRTGEFVHVNFDEMVQKCLDSPLDPAFFAQKLDPVSLLCGYVFSWSVLEYNALENVGAEAVLISPELTRTSLWLCSIMISSLSVGAEGCGEDAAEDASDDAASAALLPQISLHSPTTTRIVEFVLSKVFLILMKMPGDDKLCADAIHLIISIAECRAEALVESDHLYNLLSRLSLDNLPSRRPLIKALVITGSVINSEETRQRMYKLILEPLAAKFQSLCNNASGIDGEIVASQLADLLECFAGVADAGQSDAAPVLFRFLTPVFDGSIALMSKYAHSQLLVNSILEFFKTVTDVLFFYIESSDECQTFHLTLLNLIVVYRNTQIEKYRRMVVDDDERLENQTRDLCALIEILCYSVSKTFMPTYDGAGSVEHSAKVALSGLETILPLMNTELLKVPTLCGTFFRLLLFISDLAPNVMAEMNERMMADFMQCLNLAVADEFGTERMKCAFEIVHNLAGQFCVDRRDGHLIVTHICSLVHKVFECCLQYNYESEIFDEASNALYALICLNQEHFNRYVGGLLERPENAKSAEAIRDAFVRLLPADRPQSSTAELTRLEKRAFHDKLERFLTEIYGLLYL